MDIFLVIIGFVFLIKGADFLIEGSVSFAKRFNVSDIVIGLTLVSVGTSAPELVVNIISGIQDKTDIAIGNILGSNIANILLILGISSLISNIKSNKKTTFIEMPFNIFLVILLGFLANDKILRNSYSQISRIDGVIFLIFFAVFLYYAFFTHTKIIDEEIKERLPLKVAIFYIIVGITGLFLGGKWIVAGGVSIAQKAGISEEVIGLTLIAVGTSLPELATSIIAAIKKRTDIAIGNVVGSNIFNISFVLGISAIIKPIKFNNTSNISLGILVITNLLLFSFLLVFPKKGINKINGFIFLVLYALYLMLIF